MTKQRILITGSNGLLGQKLVGLLSLEPGVEVLATGSGPNRLPANPGYVYRTMDITDSAEVMAVVQEFHPQVIIHTAAMTNVDQCENNKEMCWVTNVTAVGYLAEAAREINAFFLHVSTDFVFDGKAGPYAESAAPNPQNFYGWSKYAAEKIVAGSGVRWAIARTVLVYGIARDMSRSNIILWVKKSLEEGTPISVVNDQWRTPTLAEDLADGCALIAKQQAEGIFHISGSDFLTPYEMALSTARYFKLDTSFLSPADSSQFLQYARRPPRTGFVLNKARAELGFNPHSFEEGIAILASQLHR